MGLWELQVNRRGKNLNGRLRVSPQKEGGTKETVKDGQENTGNKGLTGRK